MLYKKLSAACLLFSLPFSLMAQSASDTNTEWQWFETAARGQQSILHVRDELLNPDYFKTDLTVITEQLTELAQSESDATLTVKLPYGDDQFVDYVLRFDPIYAPDFQHHNPTLFTFSGHMLDDEYSVGRFDIGPLGFNGVYVVNGESYYLDALLGATNQYALYQTAIKKPHFADNILSLPPTAEALPVAHRGSFGTANGETLTTYRIAIATTGEYTDFFGGKAAAANAITTTINRVNQVYQRDFSIMLQIVGNNNDLISENAATDAFSNSPDEDDLSANQTFIDDTIGSASYDLGHVFMTGDGGLATIGSVCNNSGFKAQGGTGLSNPVGDLFAVEYVAHEVGHQFSAEHTYNGLEEGCEGQRSDLVPYEPGSGSTIMSYAGICASQNLQNTSDAYFHIASIEQVNAFVTQGAGSTCGTETSLSNNVPIVSAGNDKSIPANTPFVLTGTSNDANSDALTFVWEQFDKGAATDSAAAMVDDGSRPLFRSLAPTSSSTRYFPRLADVISGTLTLGETYATTTRALNFKFTARDGQGGVDTDDVKLSVIDTGAAFKVTSPATTQTVNGNEPLDVNWDLASTHLSPINCSLVDIWFSNNNGLSFDSVILSNTENDGFATVPFMPNEAVTAGRLMVKCADNVFFNIAPAVIRINQVANSVTPQITNTTSKTINQNNTIDLSLSDLTIVDSDSDVFVLTLLPGTNYTVQGLTVTPTTDFSGELSVNLRVSDGENTSANAILNITVNRINQAPIGVNDTASADTSSTILIDVLANDSDDVSTSLTLSGVTYAGIHQVSIVNNQLQIVTTAQDSIETMTYELMDGDGAKANATLTLTVSVPVVANTAPVLTSAQSQLIQEDSNRTFTLADFAIENTENDPLTLSLMAGNNYTLSGNTLAPNANFNGTLNVSAKVNDGELDSNTLVFNVTVSAVNDAPRAFNDSFSVTPNVKTVLDVIQNDEDDDGDALELVSAAYTGNGTVTVFLDAIEYTAASNFTGSETLSYTLKDASGSTSTATVTLTSTAEPSTPTNPTTPSSSSGGGAFGYWLFISLIGGVFMRIARKTSTQGVH
ncbi:Ig-like domain-containing protein [Algibacillus agarilyticus]|uniref:Ig-like domain-containing protein n=1 Tax=Algibacillus agarilyticus TaxID=2234133 RepID=UPI000DCFEC77|nr:tandem-95 repeat protein [Algibacillus agarilyticus]